MESSAFIGSSGTGKTQSIRRVLSLIPQVFLHTSYDAVPIDPVTQVTWLHVECPHDASPRGLCTAIFEKFDEILGSNYDKEYGGSRSTTNIMVPKVNFVVNLHCLGMLVIDEIQNLFRRKSNASAELKDFIVRIINDLRVPVLMVGTAETAEFFSETFRVTRRTTGLLQPNWSRLTETGREWIRFTNALWEYRYVTEESPLDYRPSPSEPDLRHLFFDLTQGIPDLAVKLYFLAQRYAINEKIEQVTPAVLKRVSDTALVQNKRYLADLRVGRQPKDEFVYEDVFTQQSLPLKDVRKETKKEKHPAQKRREASTSAPVMNLPGFELREVESTYEAAKSNGLTHNPEDA